VGFAHKVVAQLPIPCTAAAVGDIPSLVHRRKKSGDPRAFLEYDPFHCAIGSADLCAAGAAAPAAPDVITPSAYTALLL